MDIQQSILYQEYVRSLGWSVTHVDGVAIFHRNLPFIGTIAKIQRPPELPYLPKLIMTLRQIHATTVAIEPRANENQEVFSSYLFSVSRFFKIVRSPFLPTKTILVDTTLSDEDMFSRLTQAKRRAVRRAQKYGVTITTSDSIRDLIKIKNKSAGMFGELTTYGIEKLAKIFHRKNLVHILLAKTPRGEVVGGVLLLISGEVCYYWIAGATKKGKHMFAPSLLVWEALRFSHHKKCASFDFVGVWDERMPKQNTAWLGFTKFKEGFGGTTLYYPISTLRKSS